MKRFKIVLMVPHSQEVVVVDMQAAHNEATRLAAGALHDGLSAIVQSIEEIEYVAFSFTSGEPVGMSFITFDYKCIECGTIEPDLMLHRSEIEDVACYNCGAPMKHLMPGPITTFKFGDRSAIKSKKAVSLRD